jgi:23S rRNA (cytosine1962-C5)-methyltransferase
MPRFAQPNAAMTPQALATLQQHLTLALSDLPDETRRIFHGRGRRFAELEHLTVDWMQGVVLVSLFREPEPEPLQGLRDMLQALIASDAWRQSGAHTLLLQHRYRLHDSAEWLLGEPLEQWQITEHALRYQLDLGRNQNTGLFLDMRLGRQWVKANAQGKRVLNLFAYTCGFSLAAMAGGAQQVVNLDMAKAALNRGRDNHRLNQHDLSRVEQGEEVRPLRADHH